MRKIKAPCGNREPRKTDSNIQSRNLIIPFSWQAVKAISTMMMFKIDPIFLGLWELKALRARQERRARLLKGFALLFSLVSLSGNYTREEIAEKFNFHPDTVNRIVKQSGKVTNDTLPPNVTSERFSEAKED